MENNTNKKTDNMKGFLPGLLIGIVLAGFVCVAASIAAIGIFNTDGFYIISNIYNGGNSIKASSSNTLDLTAINSKLKLLQRIIGNEFLFDEDMTKVSDGIYKGMVSGLEDAYSVYYTEDEFNALMEESSGNYCGIGAVVQKDIKTGLVTIVRVFKQSPAEEAGLKAGDILYMVDDMEITGLDLDILVRTYIRGEEGTEVVLTVLRGDDYQKVELHITRRMIETETVEYKMLDNSIGYVTVTEFDQPTYEQFKNAIEELQKEGMKGLVIDLRNNPGGLLNTVVDMLDYMLPDGLLVYTSDKNGNGDKYYSDDGHQVDVPLVVLVNGNSASASEVFTGAIKDFKWGTIIGTKTFGKGIVQDIIPLGDGSGLKITVAHYYTPSGFDLHGKGIEPDIEVELDKDAAYGADSDNQLKAAVDELLK